MLAAAFDATKLGAAFDAGAPTSPSRLWHMRVRFRFISGAKVCEVLACAAMSTGAALDGSGGSRFSGCSCMFDIEPLPAVDMSLLLQVLTVYTSVYQLALAVSNLQSGMMQECVTAEIDSGCCTRGFSAIAAVSHRDGERTNSSGFQSGVVCSATTPSVSGNCFLNNMLQCNDK